MFQSLFTPLQGGIRFFCNPIPALHSAFLTVCLPVIGRRNTGLLRSVQVTYKWVRFCLLHRQYSVRVFPEWRGITDCFPFGLKPISIFGFFNLTTFRRQFAYANHTTQAKLPDCMILTAIVFPSRFWLLLSEGLPCLDSFDTVYYYWCICPWATVDETTG